MTKKTSYWLQAALWLVCIYTSIPLVRPVCEALRSATPFNLLINIVVGGCVGGYLIFLLVRYKPDGVTYFLLGLAVAISFYGVVTLKIPEERMHFVQYGVLAVLINRALRLDHKGWKVYLWVVIIVSLLGWVDEGIQHITPRRYYDNKDVVINSLSGLFGVYLDFIYRRAVRLS